MKKIVTTPLDLAHDFLVSRIGSLLFASVWIVIGVRNVVSAVVYSGPWYTTATYYSFSVLAFLIVLMTFDRIYRPRRAEK